METSHKKGKLESLKKKETHLAGKLKKVDNKLKAAIEEYRDDLRLQAESRKQTQQQNLFSRLERSSDEEKVNVSHADPNYVELTIGSLQYVLKKDFYGNLLEHQQEALSWLLQQNFHDRGSILADEMGLGKTISTIALIACLKQVVEPSDGAFLVVCPATVIT